MAGVNYFPTINFSDYSPVVRMINCTANGQIGIAMTLGKGSYVENATYERMLPRHHVLIGNYCSFSHDIRFIIGRNHDYKVVSTYPFTAGSAIKTLMVYSNTAIPPKWKSKLPRHLQVTVGHDVWCGLGAQIMGGVHIGNGAVIGANSVVAKDVPPYAIVVGNPARVIKYRFDEDTIRKLQAIKWWNWDLDKIRDNVALMDDVEEFVNRHYTPELEDTVNDIGGGGGG